jgi:hypothetical protein
MNDKDTKVPVYIAIIVAFLLVAAAGYYVLGGSSGKITQPTGIPAAAANETPVATVKEIPAATVKETPAVTMLPSSGATPTTAPLQAKVDVIKCELCHTNAQNLSPHVNGGKLCINCHGSQVHNIHIGAGTVNLDCNTCHGSPPKIPTIEKGEGPGHYSVCEKCHAAPPNNLEPSNGNLIVIHLSRGKYCTNCHGTDIGSIHAAALSNFSNASKNK